MGFCYHQSVQLVSLSLPIIFFDARILNLIMIVAIMNMILFPYI